MNEREPRFIHGLVCRSCKNEAPMKVVAEYSQVAEHRDERTGFPWQEGPVYQMLLCPACHDVSFCKYYYHDGFDPDDWKFDMLYPVPQDAPKGLPQNVAKAYEAALRVRNIDANAFGVLLRRVLELVCIDRRAVGRVLQHQLTDLARRNEIPEQLAEMAQSLRQLGNIGAHASAGELTSAEVPFLEKLCQAILEYVYYAPQLLQEVRERLDQVDKQRSASS